MTDHIETEQWRVCGESSSSGSWQGPWRDGFAPSASARYDFKALVNRNEKAWIEYRTIVIVPRGIEWLAGGPQ